MGNEQTSGTSTTTKSKRNNNNKKRKNLKYPSSSCLAPTYHPHITVVNSGPIPGTGSGATAANGSITDDSDLNKLAAIPKFYPILRSSINQQNDPAQIPHLENGPVGEMKKSKILILCCFFFYIAFTIIRTFTNTFSYMCRNSSK